MSDLGLVKEGHVNLNFGAPPGSSIFEVKVLTTIESIVTLNSEEPFYLLFKG